MEDKNLGAEAKGKRRIGSKNLCKTLFVYHTLYPLLCCFNIIFLFYLLFLAVKNGLVWLQIVLGNISIFWKYCDILFDNISYRGNFSISKYCPSIFTVFIDLIYVTDEVYSLNMVLKLSYDTQIIDNHLYLVTCNHEVFTCDILPMLHDVQKI